MTLLRKEETFGYCTGVFVFTQSKRVSIIGFLINLKIQDSPKMRIKASLYKWLEYTTTKQISPNTIERDIKSSAKDLCIS